MHNLAMRTFMPCPRGLYAALAVFSSVMVGCGDDAQVKRYQVPHEPGFRVTAMETSAGPSTPANAGAPSSATTATEPQRMLATIVPVDQKAWFFKAMGSVEQIEAMADDFQILMQSLTFSADTGDPTWKLPEGWQEAAGNSFRYATLTNAGAEVSVSSLALPQGQPLDAYLLANVNRWRNQLGLAPVAADELSTTSQPISIDGREAVIVDLVGQGSAGAAPMTTSSPTLPADHPPIATSDAEISEETPSLSEPGGRQSGGGLTYQVPSNWQPGRGGGFRLAAFQVEQDGLSAEVTVITLGPAAGSLLDNVNRWRGQINLPPWDAEQLEDAVATWQVAGKSAQYVNLADESPEGGQAILAVVLPLPDRTLFIKMMGPVRLVKGEQGNFESFAKSLELTP